MRTYPTAESMNDLQAITCDLCGNTAKLGLWPQEKDPNGFDIICLYHHVKSKESSEVTVTEYDLCPTCFQEKLVPLLAKEGCNGTRYVMTSKNEDGTFKRTRTILEK